MGRNRLADDKDILVTRERPSYQHDNAPVEKRNGDWVRRHAFRYRYDTQGKTNLLNERWALVMAP